MRSDSSRTAARRPGHAAWAIGTAVLGRPAYITTGAADALPDDRSVDAMRQATFAVLDAALAAGVDWVDTARSYGRAEEFVGDWWRERSAADPEWVRSAPTVSSKWGYAYVGDWDRDAAVHEVKEHSAAQFRRQWALTEQTLPRLALYQVHSLTTDSPLFDDDELLDALAELRDSGVAIGFTTTGTGQADTIGKALDVERQGARLFSAVQSTWNLMETSVGDALALASRNELTVLIKESLANGRLLSRPPKALREIAADRGVTLDAVALAVVARQPWVDRVLLGSAGVEQLASNVAATSVELDDSEVDRLLATPQDPAEYWADRSALAWT